MNMLKRLGGVVLALIAVGGICFLSWDYQLRASVDDGTTTASQQQQAVEEASKPVEVIVPAKEKAEEPVKEKAEEPAKEESSKPEKEETPKAETPEKGTG